MSSVTCYNCTHSGHFARDCPEPQVSTATLACTQCAMADRVAGAHAVGASAETSTVPSVRPTGPHAVRVPAGGVLQLLRHRAPAQAVPQAAPSAQPALSPMCHCGPPTERVSGRVAPGALARPRRSLQRRGPARHALLLQLRPARPLGARVRRPPARQRRLHCHAPCRALRCAVRAETRSKATPHRRSRCGAQAAAADVCAGTHVDAVARPIATASAAG